MQVAHRSTAVRAMIAVVHSRACIIEPPHVALPGFGGSEWLRIRFGSDPIVAVGAKFSPAPAISSL